MAEEGRALITHIADKHDDAIEALRQMVVDDYHSAFGAHADGDEWWLATFFPSCCVHHVQAEVSGGGGGGGDDN